MTFLSVSDAFGYSIYVRLIGGVYKGLSTGLRFRRISRVVRRTLLSGVYPLPRYHRHNAIFLNTLQIII